MHGRQLRVVVQGLHHHVLRTLLALLLALADGQLVLHDNLLLALLVHGRVADTDEERRLSFDGAHRG